MAKEAMLRSETEQRDGGQDVAHRDLTAMQPAEDQLEWEQGCPRSITTDVIWKLDAYRTALFLLHLSRKDCQALFAAKAEEDVARQLTRSAASVSANLAEGYSRSTRADRIRFLDYALGSTRECVSWYEASRNVLPKEAIDQRLLTLSRIRSLLLGLIRSFRERTAPRFEP
jgi:four helix bundle protein